MNSNSDLLPKVPIVKKAGMAKKKLTPPKPTVARRAWKFVAPPSRKMVEEYNTIMLMPHVCWAIGTIKEARWPGALEEW